MPDMIGAATEAWLRQLVGGLGPLFVLGALLFWVQRWTQLSLAEVIGWRGIVYWTGWLGTPIHELSHWIVGKLFGVRITEVNFFSPDREDGVLGYVRYQVPRLRAGELPQVMGTFLMGIAPLFGGALVLWGARLALLDPQADEPFYSAATTFAQDLGNEPMGHLVRDFFELVQLSFRPILENAANDPKIWVYLYVALAVGAHLAPSRADLRGGQRGLILLALLALFANVVALASGYDPNHAASYLARVTAPLTTLLTLALVLNVGHGAVAFAAAQTRRLVVG